MEHFFNRKPTKGYIQYVKDLDRENDKEKEIFSDDSITVPYYLSKAACYVEDAHNGRLANGKGKMSDMSQRIQMCFFIQTHAWWSRFIYFSVVLLSLLVFFEPSSSIAITFCNAGWFNLSNDIKICRDDLIIKWQAWTLCIEFLMIMVFVYDVLMKQAYMKPRVYWTKKWHKVSGFFILMFIFDWMIFILTYAITGSGLRFSRPFRPVLLLTRHRELRRILETLLSMKKDLIRQCSIIIVYIVLFAWVGVTLYGDTYKFTKDCIDLGYSNVSASLALDPEYCVGNPCWNTSVYPFCVCTEQKLNYSTGCDNDTIKHGRYYLPENYLVYTGSFDDILHGTVRLMAQLSTENYPDLILPAYKVNSFNIVYFIVFIFIGIFLLTSVLLAVIVEFWLRYLKKTNDTEKRKERLGITKAFTWIDAERNYIIDEKSWNLLILLLKKDFTKVQSQFMFDMLDWEEKGYLDVLDFLNIREAMKLQYKFRNITHSIENTKYGAIARGIIGFRYDFNLCGLIKTQTINMGRISFGIVALHTILALLSTPNALDSTTKATLRVINSFLIVALLLDQGLRLLAKGVQGYLQTLNNRWEIVTVSCSALAMISFWIIFLIGIPAFQSTLRTMADLCLVLWEVVIILRPSISGTIIVFFYKVINVLADLFIFIIIIVYVFMVIGLEMFAIHSNGPNGNYFEQYSCGIGFSTPICASITMWQQITTSNWHEMMNSVADATGSSWSYIYFCTLYVTINLVLLDLTIAMTIEMYNAIKAQYFTKTSGKDSDGDEGAIFQIASPELQFRRHDLFSRKKSSTPIVGLRHFQVAQSGGSSWRQSVLNSDGGKISIDDLDKIQKSIESVKLGHGEMKGKLYLNSKDTDLNVRQMFEEKASEAKNLDNPECVLYFRFPVCDYEDKEVGEMVVEMKDHHSHDAIIKLNFNTSLKPANGQIYSMVNGKEQVYMENITFLPKIVLINTDYDYHGFQSTHWVIKKSQRKQLKKDNIKVRVLLYDESVQPDKEISKEDAEKMILTAHIKGYAKERERWDEKQKEIKQTRKTFGDISFLLERNAYRVSIRKDVHVWSEDSNKGVDDKDAEKGKRGKKDNRTIYILDKNNSEKDINKAHKAWKRCLTIERSVAHIRAEEAMRTLLSFTRSRSRSTSRRASVTTNIASSNTSSRSRIASDEDAKIVKIQANRARLRNRSLANIMLGSASNPSTKAKLAALAVKNANDKSRSSSRSSSPRRSPTISEVDTEIDQLAIFNNIVLAKVEPANYTSSSSDEIHSEDESASEKSDDSANDFSDESREEDERKGTGNSKTGSTGSAFDKIKANLRKITSTGIQSSNTSDPSLTPTSIKSCLCALSSANPPLLEPPQRDVTSRSFPTTPNSKTKLYYESAERLKMDQDRPIRPRTQTAGPQFTLIVTEPEHHAEAEAHSERSNSMPSAFSHKKHSINCS